jgi:protocatechuate 3,4-dioxygenase beta subunit
MFRFLAVLTPLFLAIGSFERSAAADTPASGLRPGEQVEPWNPVHVTGPDRGTNLCPVCTYLEKPVVVVFAKDTANTNALASRLEPLARKHRAAGLRVVVAVVEIGPDRAKALAADLKFTDLSLCYLTSKTGPKELKAYRIDPTAENTVMVYKNYTVEATFLNLPAKDDGRVAEVVEKLLK